MHGCQQRLHLYVKDPDSVLDYRWDWSQWLTEGEAITNAEFLTSAGLTLGSVSHDGDSATVWLSAGELCDTYTVTNRITTDQGRVRDQSIRVQIYET